MSLCIYHGNCADGFGAAWVVRKALGETEFHPGKYQEPPPDVTGKDVVMVDFSYKRPVLLEMAAKANSILILDHHVSAMNDIGPLPKSAAVILSNGETAYIDEADLPLVSGYSWSEHVKGGAIAYAGGGRSAQQHVYMHHLILPKRDGATVDHVNRNSLDNRRVNLRYATKQQNAANMDRGSPFKGVTRHENRFVAQITVDRENRYLGIFDSAEDAARAYDKAAQRAFGEYARCNFGQPEPFPPNCHFKFDMNHSGAMLTWEHFFPGQEPPPLLLHIEDRDLWRFALQNTRQIQANVFSFPYDFQVWDALMAAAPAALAAEGEAIERKHFKDIRELLGVTTREMVIGGHRVPVANLPYTMSSDAGHELAKGRPFAACYWDTPEGRVFSLRSNDGVDVSEVAKQYGGGGHRNAAGFRVSFSQALAFELEITE